MGFPVAQLVKICLQCWRPGFSPWVGKIPWRREGLPTPVFWPGIFHGLYSPWGHKELDMTGQLSLSLKLLIIYIVIIYILLFGNNTYCVHTQSCSTLCSCLRESSVGGQTHPMVSPQPQLFRVNRCS